MLSQLSTSSSRTVASPGQLDLNETFTRFILDRNKFSAGNGRVKPAAFLPEFNSKAERFETSVYRVANLSPAEIWSLGYRYVENQSRDRFVKARGSGTFRLAQDAALKFDVCGEPYPRHVDVVGWPEDKATRLMKATEIADNLNLSVDPRTK